MVRFIIGFSALWIWKRKNLKSRGGKLHWEATCTQMLKNFTTITGRGIEMLSPLPNYSGGFSGGGLGMLRRRSVAEGEAPAYGNALLVLDLTGVLVPHDSLLAARLCAEHRPHLVSRGMEMLKKYGGGGMSATKLIEGCAYMLRGLTEEQVKAGARKIEPAAGAREFIYAAQERGFVPAIITSDLQEAAEKVAGDLGIPQELAVGNVGVYDGGAHAGAFIRPYVADAGKVLAAQRLKENLGAQKVVAVGDDWTNQNLFDGSDFSVAYNAPLGLAAHARVDGGFEQLLAALD